MSALCINLIDCKEPLSFGNLLNYSNWPESSCDAWILLLRNVDGQIQLTSVFIKESFLSAKVHFTTHLLDQIHVL